MKQVLFLIAILLVFTCKKEETVNKIIPDEKEESVMLIGISTRKGFDQEPFKVWYDEYYSNHRVNDSLLTLIEPLLKDVSIKVFIGTWCEDSQRELPALYKILDQVYFEENKLELIALNRDKVTPDSLHIGFDIDYVPTIIFNKNGKELNRIVEYPLYSLEEDMLSILRGEDYKHSYFE